MYNSTLMTKCLTANIEQTIKSLGYAYFTKGDYNLNIIGIRSTNSENTVNEFNDALVVTYKVDGSNRIEVYPITTDPGTYYLKSPLHSKGCAILVPGQYRGAEKIGKHQGKYKALVQCRPVNVYRDNNKDNKLDYVNIESGMFGINIHKAGMKSTQVNKNSAGCQVFAKADDFNKFMKLCDEACKTYGDRFTYTLIEEKDLIL